MTWSTKAFCRNSNKGGLRFILLELSIEIGTEYESKLTTLCRPIRKSSVFINAPTDTRSSKALRKNPQTWPSSESLHIPPKEVLSLMPRNRVCVPSCKHVAR